MTKLDFKVSGMHCSSCELLVKDEISAVKDVTLVQVDHKSGLGTVQFANGYADKGAILKAIENAGYKGSIVGDLVQPQLTIPKELEIEGKINKDTDGGFSFKGIIRTEKKDPIPRQGGVQDDKKEGTQKVNLSLYGMHCSSCAALIERSIKKVTGVTSANVNFAAEKASVVYDGSQTKHEDLITAVEKAGYKAVFVDAKDTQADMKRQQEEIQNQLKKFIVSFVLSFPMIYFMLLDFFSFLPGRMFFFPYIGIISFILTTPVQFIIGRGFYKGMWSAIRMKTFKMDSLIAIGTSVAYFYSVINFVNYLATNSSLIGLGGMKIPELYFETAAFLITFVVLGKFLEAKAKGRTSEAIKKLMGLQAKTARVVRDGQT